MTALVGEAADAVKASLRPSEFRALVMIGGYGRGEGGVEVVDGQERPHNNLDFLLIAETASPTKLWELRQRLLRSLDPVMRTYDIEIDVSVVSVWKLRFSPSLIIWYDARFGHKTILGDADYMPSLTRFRLEAIPSRDALRLLVNRGTLLVINAHLLDEENGSATHRRRITRNVMKATIGYGDALLYFLGDYHWSYVERQRRMQRRADVAAEFRALYDEAAEFRFQPGYERYEARDLAAWLDALRAAFEPIHRFCEQRRLGVRELRWDEYAEHALAHGLIDEPLSVRAWARKAVHFARGSGGPDGLGLQAKLGYRALGRMGRYPIVFPLVAYHVQSMRLKEFAKAALETRDDDDHALRDAYLRLWCGEVDINAQSTLRKWHVPVTPASSG